MQKKDPIWPVRELMGYRPLSTAMKRRNASDTQSAGAIEPLERRSMISGPMAIALAAGTAPASETHLGFDATDNFESPDGAVPNLATNPDAGEDAFAANPGDAGEYSTFKCCPELVSMQLPKVTNESQIPRTYTLATFHLPPTHDVRHLKKSHRRMTPEGATHTATPDLAVQIMASGVAIDFDQAAGVSAMLAHHALLPGIVFNPVAGIAALVA